MKRFLGGIAAALYVVACFLPGDPSGSERIEFQLDFAVPYRVPLAGTVEPTVRITAAGQALSNPHYRLESLDQGIVRVAPTGRGLEGTVRGTTAVRVVYETATATVDTVFPVQVVVSRIVVGPPDTSLTQLGATTSLSATAYDARDAAVPAVAFTWSSADPQVAAVNDAGLVRAVDEGTAAVMAEADSVTGLASVTVSQTAAQVRMAPERDTLRTIQRSAQFIAFAFDDTGGLIRTARPRWASSDTMVAIVDGAGRATATGAGTTRIVARVGEAADTATLVVAQVPRVIVVTPGFDTLTAIADTARLGAVAFDSLNFSIPSPTVAWATSDAAVATVDPAGLVRAERNGVVLVTASAAGQAASATVLVRQEVVDARIAEDNVTLAGAGATVRLSGTSLDRNGFVVDGAVLTWSSGSECVASVDGTGLVTAMGGGATRITATPANGGRSDTAGVIITGAPAVEGGDIAFESPRGIEIMCAGGGGRKALIAGAAEPTWSPDGTRLAFTRGCAIHTANADGSDERQVTGGTTCDFGPAWSPDGTKIAFSRMCHSSPPPNLPQLVCDGFTWAYSYLHIAGADGSSVTFLGRFSINDWDVNPTWSPDGTRLAFEGSHGAGEGVYVIKSDGTEHEYTGRTIYNGYDPAWSPDGSQIAFSYGDLSLFNVDGSGGKSLGVWGEDPAWSPDGSRLVFTGHDGSQFDLYLINRDGTGLQRLTSTPEYEFNPTWRSGPSPAGLQAAPRASRSR